MKRPYEYYVKRRRSRPELFIEMCWKIQKIPRKTPGLVFTYGALLLKELCIYLHLNLTYCHKFNSIRNNVIIQILMQNSPILFTSCQAIKVFKTTVIANHVFNHNSFVFTSSFRWMKPEANVPISLTTNYFLCLEFRFYINRVVVYKSNKGFCISKFKTKIYFYLIVVVVYEGIIWHKYR